MSMARSETAEQHRAALYNVHLLNPIPILFPVTQVFTQTQCCDEIRVNSIEVSRGRNTYGQHWTAQSFDWTGRDGNNK